MKSSLKYWEQLKKKYFKKDSEEVMEWYKRYQVQTKILLSRFGKSSWEINDFAHLLSNEIVSESHFRELVRYEMNESFTKIITDKYNAINSKLADLEQVKLDKRVLDTEQILKLKAQLSLLKELKMIQ